MIVNFEILLQEECADDVTERQIYEREAELKQSIRAHLEAQDNCLSSTVVKVKVIAKLPIE